MQWTSNENCRSAEDEKHKSRSVQLEAAFVLEKERARSTGYEPNLALGEVRCKPCTSRRPPRDAMSIQRRRRQRPGEEEPEPAVQLVIKDETDLEAGDEGPKGPPIALFLGVPLFEEYVLSGQPHHLRVPAELRKGELVAGAPTRFRRWGEGRRAGSRLRGRCYAVWPQRHCGRRTSELPKNMGDLRTYVGWRGRTGALLWHGTETSLPINLPTCGKWFDVMAWRTSTALR